MLSINNNIINLSKNNTNLDINFADGPNILLVSYNKYNCYISVNGGEKKVTPLNNTIINFEKYAIGVNINNGQDNFSGILGEFLIFSDYEMYKKLEGYLAWKWNIISKLPSSHKYKNDIIVEDFLISPF